MRITTDDFTVMNMGRRAGTSTRAQALAKAADAVARRDAQRIARDKAIQAALAQFFQAQDEVERIRTEARTAEEPFDTAARNAIRTLDRLGETRTGIAELTGLPLTKVREYLTEDHCASPPDQESAPEQNTIATGPIDDVPEAPGPMRTRGQEP
jgi:hypothetical protein